MSPDTPLFASEPRCSPQQCIPDHFKGDPKGWPKHPGGKGRFVRGADLPRLVYVRWQSMAEPQTYEAYLDIPESARQTMLQGEKRLAVKAVN